MSNLSPLRRQLSGANLERSRALDDLGRRSVLLAGLIDACSRRRDVRELRAKVVLLLLALRCPISGKPREAWYVPGAVARLGAEGILRAWKGFFGEDGPCLRSLRSHIGCLEQSGILQRSPGDWLPWRRDAAHPERRPRWPDTFHVLDGERATEYWSGPGLRLLELHPAARYSPDLWRRLFKGWRTGAVQDVLDFAGVAVSPRRAAANSDEGLEVRRRGEVLARALSRASGPLAVLEALAGAGAELRGGLSFRAAGAWPRLRLAGGLLARALERGDRVRNPGGFLWSLFLHASPQEFARAQVLLGEPGP